MIDLKKYYFQLPGIIIIALVLSSCSKESKEPLLTKEQLVEMELDKRLKIFRAQRIEQCRKDAYLEAAQLADSTLIARARAERTKLGDRPQMPIKPILSDTLSTKDSMELKPLIN